MRIQIPYGMKQGTYYVQCSGYHYNNQMTKDLHPKNKVTLPDGSEEQQDILTKDRPRWPFTNTHKKGSCPFSLIYKKWIVHPDDVTKHPAYRDPNTAKDGEEPDELREQNAMLSQTDGVGVYYLNKFRGVHNHPLDFNLMDP